jgi:hypothetical protein
MGDILSAISPQKRFNYRRRLNWPAVDLFASLASNSKTTKTTLQTGKDKGKSKKIDRTLVKSIAKVLGNDRRQTVLELSGMFDVCI